MATVDPIKVEGLREFSLSLKKLDKALPKALRLGFNAAAQIVVDDAKPRIPRKTGRAAAALRVSSTQTSARVTAGGKKAPHFAWLDFGGKRRGRGGGIVERPFFKDGRYVWKSFADRRDDVLGEMSTQLVAVAQQAGLEVT